MYELEVNHDLLQPDDLPEEANDSFYKYLEHIEGFSVIPWEEHCTECAMPQCYKTCDLYEKRKDGKCRRFIGGIATIASSKNKYKGIVRIRFKRWGQLLAYANIHMIPTTRATLLERSISRIDSIISSFPDQNVSILGRHSPSSRFMRRFKQSIVANGYLRSKGAGLPDYFIIEVYNPNNHDVNLTFTINSRTPEEYSIGYQELLKLGHGFKRHLVPTVDIIKKVDLAKDISVTFNPNILSKDDEGTVLYFGMLTFAWDSSFRAREANRMTKSNYIKVIAWDLDNTIWDGTLLEDGSNKVTLKPNIINIIKELDQRGILNTIVSKNNPDDALKKLESIGLLEYFLHPKIGWDQKGTYLKSLIDQFNVGSNTFAFIDDSPFERDEALSVNPDIRVYDASDYMTLLDRPEFSPPISTESHKRRSLYKTEISRDSKLSSYNGDYMDFLRDCDICLKIYTPRIVNIERIQELVQRTNQLNFSGNRYNRNKIQNIINGNKHDTFCMDCEDKYGQYGTVGFAIVEKETTKLIDLMLSCRVQSKRVEHAVMCFLLKYYKMNGQHEFTAIFNQTDRNKKAGSVFKDMGFAALLTSGNSVTYNFNLGSHIPTDGIIKTFWNEQLWDS